MPKRGKVLRDPYGGPGLLMVEGKQYPFLMERQWRSDVPAKPGLMVDVDFDTKGNLHKITAISEYRLCTEQGGARGTPDRDSAVSQGWALITQTPAQLAAATLLILTWFFLTALSIHEPSFGRTDLTFWQILGYLNAGNFPPQISEIASPDAGVFGFLAIVTLVGPFFHFFWDHRRALFGGLLPLAFMFLAGFMDVVHGLLESPLIAGYGATTHGRHSIWSAISLGLGTYVSISLGMYFAVLSVTRFVASRPRGRVEISKDFAA